MKQLVFWTFSLTLILTAQSWAQGQNFMSASESSPSNKFDASWRLSLAGTDRHDERSQAKLVDFRTDIKARYLLSHQLLLDVQPSLRLQSGQTQSVDGADKAENKIQLYQAAAHYAPLNSLQISAGALNQETMHTRLLIDRIAFPAARLTGKMKVDGFASSLALETAIPTSSSLSANTKELEPTPSLNSAILKMQISASPRQYAKASAGYFIYGNLPSAVAQASNLLGNTVHELSSADHKFAYHYEGYEAAAEVKYPVFFAVDLFAGAEYIQNTKTLSEYSRGTNLYVGTELYLKKDMQFVVEGSYFSVAPDAAVAFFNAGGYETNRVGYAAETAFSFRKQGFKVGLKYIDSEVMFIDEAQTREKTLLIKLETFYAQI